MKRKELENLRRHLKGFNNAALESLREESIHHITNNVKNGFNGNLEYHFLRIGIVDTILTQRGVEWILQLIQLKETE